MTSLTDLQDAVETGRPLTMVTAYDSTTARLVDKSDVDMILVGDSVGLAMLGYDGTDQVTLDELVHHAAAVTRVVEDTFVMVDLPFGTYNVSPEQAVRHANRLKKEGGADAIKLEGGVEVADAVAAISEGGIPVFGHIGVTPQTESGSLAVQGKTADDAARIVTDARAIEDAGAVGMVIELVAIEASRAITDAVDGITIGIGAGPHCDAQVLTVHDLLGLADLLPETAGSVRANMGEDVVATLNQFHEAVGGRSFPGPETTDAMAKGEPEKIQ